MKGPKEPTPENLAYPEVGRLEMSPLVGAHTVYPLGEMTIPEFAKDKFGAKRSFIMIVDEALINECQAGEARQMVWFVDATIETKPMVVASYTPLEASGNFCERGGRFGAHSSNESMAPVFYQKLAFVTLFNAGVRAIDIRNPYQPRRSATSFRRSPKRPTSAASRSTARTAARSRSRATTWRPTIAATSTWSTAPIPGCTSSK